MTIDLSILYVFNVSHLMCTSIAICATVLNIIKIIIKIRTEKIIFDVRLNEFIFTMEYLYLQESLVIKYF